MEVAIEQAIDLAKIEFKPGHKYLLFLDPTRFDFDNLDNLHLPVDVLVLPMLTNGKPMRDCVYATPIGGSAEKWIENFVKQQEETDGVPE